MEAAERDTTDEWRISPAREIATVAELEGRIDVALATARSAEEAALEIGAASLEAAEQARRAAAMAERASVAAVRASESAAAAGGSTRPAPTPIALVEPPAEPTPIEAAEPEVESPPVPAPPAPIVADTPSPPPARTNGTAPRGPDPFEERIAAFRERAELVVIRLRKLEASGAPTAR